MTLRKKFTWLCFVLLAFVFTMPARSADPASRRVLRISADPNNLPFTNERLEGFENKIAAIIAKELDCELQYIWRAQRRGFFRIALKEGECDLVLGAPVGFDRALVTKPYYRSSYVFVARKDRSIGIQSFDNPKLRTLKIGVQMVGSDGFNTPPVHALNHRGLVNQLVGFTVYGNYAEENPPARIVEAVAKSEVDVAVVWGPLAGYFAKSQAVPLELTPVKPTNDPPGLTFAFDIGLGVRKGNRELRDQLNEILKRKQPEIDRILDDYGVPRAKE
ncbi:MAG: substrate-binding domain-containing protein [Gemmataceae bacterium]